MKVYVLTMTSQLGQGDQPSSSVLGGCMKAKSEPSRRITKQ